MTALAPNSASVANALADEPLLTENARKVLEARYLKKDEAGTITEAPSSLFRRVARTMADPEALYGATETERRHWTDRFYTLMTSGAFMPNSPTLMNAGRELGMLSACFVLPVRDSINDIFDAIKHTAMIQKAGGGTGFAFDELRPTGDYIQSSGGTTSGPISFWRAFSEATNAIQQGAFRRGANMGMMYIHHPDILKFLHAKQDLSQFTNYNISVKITDAWMDEFLADGDLPHIVRNPRNGRAFLLPRGLDIWKYDIRSLVEVTEYVSPVTPESRECYYTSPRLVKATEFRARFVSRDYYTRRDLWNIIVTNAHATGEPGIVFIDRINEANPTPHLGRMESTNPCGEQPLLPYEACNLGSINLGVFITNPLTPAAGVDWELLRDAVHLAVRFLDNVIDANNYVLPEIDDICKGNRKIGLGIMGFADALYKLGVAYNSDDGVLWGERFMKFVNDEAHRCSEHLARCRGCFPNWKGSTWQTRHNRMMRNACSTTVAPTGTISIIANCSGGIEPMFSLAFIRNVLRGQKQGEKPLVEVNETFLEVAKRRGFHSDALLERIAREGTLAHIDEVPDDVKRVFVCAHDITPAWHMKMQAAFQRHCDSSISKTINFPHDASRGDVEEIYRLAYEMRCKGVTVYRDGCRDFQPMALKKEGAGAEGARAAASDAAVAAKAEPEAPARVSEPEAPARAAQPPAAAVPGAAPAGGTDNANPSAAMPITLSEVQAAESHSPPAAPRAAAPHAPAGLSASASTPGAAAVPRASAAPGGLSASASPVGPGAPPPPAASPSAPAAAGRIAVRPLEPQDLPEIVSGLRIRQATPFGNMHVKITVDPRADRELEVFAQLGKGGDVATSDLEAICRMISLWLRAGGGLNLVIRQLEGIGSSLQIPTRSGRIMSLGDGLACALKKYTTAKSRFGLRPLLLGEIDPADMDNPLPPPHHAYAPGGSQPAPERGKGNGNGSHATAATESSTPHPRPAVAPAVTRGLSVPSALGATGVPGAMGGLSAASSRNATGVPGATGGLCVTAPAATGVLPATNSLGAAGGLSAAGVRGATGVLPGGAPQAIDRLSPANSAAVIAASDDAPIQNLKPRFAPPAAFQTDATGNFLARPADESLFRSESAAEALLVADAPPAELLAILSEEEAAALALAEPAEVLDLRLSERLALASAAEVAVDDPAGLSGDLSAGDAPVAFNSPALPAAGRPAPTLDARLLIAPRAVERGQSEPAAQNLNQSANHFAAERAASRAVTDAAVAATADAADAVVDAAVDADAGVIALLDEPTEEETEQAVAERYARLSALAALLAEDDDAGASAARRALTSGDTFVLRSGHDSALHYKICCPQCDGHLAMQEGCRKCMNCGWAAC